MVRAIISNKKKYQKQKKIRNKQLDRLQKVIRVKFKNKSMLRRAMTHRSFVNESGRNVTDNERLEYLGDSVLALVVNEYLFRHFEEYREGKLAKIKSAVVSEATLAKIARRIDLGEFILMGKGEEHSGGRDRPSILANTFEAVIGAMFLDSGMKTCRTFVLNLIRDEIESADSPTSLRDPKTTLQEYVQKKYKERPEYQVIEERGPDHNKEFTVRLIINGREIITGDGPSKRKAEMNAARASLKKIEDGDIDI
ncbi:MAG: ribonuclease III [Spirochaetes bacterium RBG_13_51_14]|nr:MAG: ribonuclease III [Spirochaetes bacterium RBG_13_51_14]